MSVRTLVVSDTAPVAGVTLAVVSAASGVMMQTLARVFTKGSGGAPKQRGTGAQLPAVPPQSPSSVHVRAVLLRQIFPSAGPKAHSPGLASRLALRDSVSSLHDSASSVSVV